MSTPVDAAEALERDAARHTPTADHVCAQCGEPYPCPVQQLYAWEIGLRERLVAARSEAALWKEENSRLLRILYAHGVPLEAIERRGP